jgi:2-iminoacetate synthase ThiH
MIEENVVSAAGANNRFNSDEMQSIIREAGFVPRRRNQKYESINTPQPSISFNLIPQPFLPGEKERKKRSSAH